MQRPIRHHDAAPLEQIVDLGQIQIILLKPGSDPVAFGLTRPRLPSARRPLGPHRLPHGAEQLVGQLLLTAVADQPGLLRSLDVAAHGLALYACGLGDGPHDP
jgi:hypothetical protein